MLLPLMSPEGAPATEASGRGRTVEGRPVLVQSGLQRRYLVHVEVGVAAARRPGPVIVVRPQPVDRERVERLRPAAAVDGAAVAGGGADGARPLQRQREVVELALLLPHGGRGRGRPGEARAEQTGGDQRPDRQQARRRRRRHCFRPQIGRAHV